MPADLTVRIGPLTLKNPVMAGSGEATMTLESLMAALDAGAGAVVGKSANESAAAKRQLASAEYALLDERWEELPWGAAPRHASLFCRSGLQPEPFEQWLDTLARADRHARRLDAYVVASLVVGDPTESGRMASQVQEAGLRWLELNVGPPHAEESPPGAIRAETRADAVRALVEPIRAATSLPLTVKLAGRGDPVRGAEAARAAGADAICLTGRQPAFLPDPETRRPVLGTFGAIGGFWALPVTCLWLAKARAALGPEAALIGTNGARGGLDVVRFLLAGASAAQMTSVVVTDGPASLTRAIQELDAYCTRQETSAAALVGEAADHVKTYGEAAAEANR